MLQTNVKHCGLDTYQYVDMGTGSYTDTQHFAVIIIQQQRFS